MDRDIITIVTEGLQIRCKVVEIPGDGACLFSSLSYLIHGNISNAAQIRANIVNHVTNNWQIFKCFTMDRSGVSYGTKRLYLADMSKPHTYGTTCELKAAGEIYPYEFKLFQDGIHIASFGNPLQGIKLMRFNGHFNEGHFDVLIPIDSTNLPSIVATESESPLVPIMVELPLPTPKSPNFSSYINEAQYIMKSQVDVQKKDRITEFQFNASLDSSDETLLSASEKTSRKRRKRFTDNIRKKQIKAANKKYNEIHPEVNRAAVSKYAKNHPEVKRAAANKYAQKHPEVNKQAVQNYRQKKQTTEWKNKFMSGCNYDHNINYYNDKSVNLGPRIPCSWCQSYKWHEEPNGMCCSGGKVQIPIIDLYPEPLHSLLTHQHTMSEHFLASIRQYNGCFQMTSFGAKEVKEGNFMPTFKVQGQVYHKIGSILTNSQEKPSFLQIYFVGDDNTERNIRCGIFSGVKPGLVNELQKMLHQKNKYIKDFKAAIDSVPVGQNEFKLIISANKKPVGEHPGRFNAPTSREVAIVIVGQEFEKRDIIIHSRDNKLMRISETHRAYDCLQYPLMFCRGEDGYEINIPQHDPITKQALKKTVSAADFYSHRLMERSGQECYLLFFRSLLSQFLVDMYAKIETERLNYIRNNQKRLRSEEYVHLKDALDKEDGTLAEFGKIVVLPSSFTGGPRYMHERTQDALTYVRHYGRPDLFITFTCNPKWPEIVENLKQGQKSHDRHDLIARVFRLKVKCIINLLTKGCIFGNTKCHMYTVEWQKRGLPHIHILLWLEEKIRPDSIDKIISAEIPDPNMDSSLYEIVTSTMVHGPCGVFNRNSPCMVEGICSKKYPHTFLKETQTGEDGYPKYRRRSQADGGLTAKLNEHEIDNRWIVPYNPVLSRTFSAHINVEYCNSVKAIKYICKYINKGSDQATFTVKDKDEVTRYETGRYISSSEAAWRIFCFPIHERFPPVVHLAVHLENGQRLYFNENNVVERINNPPKTTLQAFFDLCQVDNLARTLLYSEVPAYYVWKNNKFEKRKQGQPVPGFNGVKKDKVLGRVYTVHPVSNPECYYLRLLLHEVRGPTSFIALKTVAGVVHTTFQEACKALGLLEDDAHWDRTLEEASLSRSSNKIRELFAIMIVFCQLADPKNLWEKYRDSLAEDIKRRLERECDNISLLQEDTIYNQCLIIIEDIVMSMSGKTLSNFGLSFPFREQVSVLCNRQYLMETSYNTSELNDVVAQSLPKLNQDQKKAYNRIMDSISSDHGDLFFIDAPGGTGKTFLINLLLATVRGQNNIAIAVASSGIAATLIDGGKTAHSAFKLPLNLNYSEIPLCNIPKQSDFAEVLRRANLIVWDEATMAHKKGVEALDRTLQDIRNCNRLMGGVTVLLAGDFRQTLPVIPRGTRANEVQACLKSSFLWLKVKVMSLKINMRVHLKKDSRAEEFSKLLLDIGDGNIPEVDGKINIPYNLCTIVKTLNSLTDKIYPDINLGAEHNSNSSWLRERAILTPKNDTANEINTYLLGMLPGSVVIYESVDSVLEVDEAVHYPVEFLNSLNPPGIPPHSLHLKVGAPVILLRNLNPPKLCNGTRLQITSLHKNIIEAKIFTGIYEGEIVFIPQIPLMPSDYQIPFKRVQFPVKLCYAMTINKAQGQTLKVAGIDLRNDCFSHGQLYVACSRVSDCDSLYILQPESKTRNVVYKEVFQK